MGARLVQSLNVSQSARMDEFPDEAGPRAYAAATAPRDEDVGEREARASDAIVARCAPPLAAGLLTYCPHTAIAAWLVGVAWLVGSHFVGPTRTVVQQESVQSAERGLATQEMAEESRAQKADVAAMHAAQALSTRNATGLGSAKPRLDAAKTEINAAIAEPPNKLEHLRPKSADKLSKASERLDRIGLKVAALLAAAPVADRSVSPAMVARRRAQNARHDAFDPSKNPGAPGAPRPLGTIAPAASAKNAAAEYAYGQRTN
jgi:hypothetical protein